MKYPDDKLDFYIVTYSGKRIYFNDLDKNVYDIEDIAHALSQNNRFNGHTSRPYNVAQHSVLVQSILKEKGFSKEKQLKALLHDASEAYMTDLPSPFKKQPMFKSFVELENVLQNKLYEVFGCEKGEDHDIKSADLVMLFTEKRDLMGDPDWGWGNEIERLPQTLIPWNHTLSKKVFLSVFNNLKNDLKK